MTRRGALALTSVALAVALGAGIAGAAPLEVHYPPENLVVSGGGLLHVLFGADGAPVAREFEVRLNGVAADPVVARSRSGSPTVFHVTLHLEPGLNTIDISRREGERVVARVERRVFLVSQLAKDKDPPVRFDRKPFHVLGAEQACVGCHQLEPRATDVGPASPEDSTCFACHAGLTRTKEVHGPAALWVCTRCHDPDTRPARYVTPDPVMPLCFSCHAEQKEHFFGNPYQHGPTATGYCTICHNPHGTDNQFFLKKGAWDLCTTCHFEKATGRHVISWGPNGQGHPTRGKPDPRRKAREFACPSCHNPHAAAGQKLWNFQATRWLDLCRNCHQRMFGG